MKAWALPGPQPMLFLWPTGDKVMIYDTPAPWPQPWRQPWQRPLCRNHDQDHATYFFHFIWTTTSSANRREASLGESRTSCMEKLHIPNNMRHDFTLPPTRSLDLSSSAKIQNNTSQGTSWWSCPNGRSAIFDLQSVENLKTSSHCTSTATGPGLQNSFTILSSDFDRIFSKLAPTPRGWLQSRKGHSASSAAEAPWTFSPMASSSKLTTSTWQWNF